jgi:hypothetical protein
MRELFTDNDDISIECKYNKKFKKWQPICVSKLPVSAETEL